MNLTITHLKNCFDTAIKSGYKYVAVKVDMQGYEKPEIIINQRDNFYDKYMYYENAYDKNLHLKANPGIRIIGFTMADTYEDIENDLVEIDWNE